MTDDRNLWHDRCEAYKREVERTAQELTKLRDACRTLLVWHDNPKTDWRWDYPAGQLEQVRKLVMGADGEG